MKRQAHNWYLDFCIHPSFEGVNTLFVWSSENEDDWRSYKRYYLPIREIKYYNQCYDRWKIFLINQQKMVWEHMIAPKKLRQVRDMITDYTTVLFAHYNYFKYYYKMIIIDYR